MTRRFNKRGDNTIVNDFTLGCLALLLIAELWLLSGFRDSERQNMIFQAEIKANESRRLSNSYLAPTTK